MQHVDVLSLHRIAGSTLGAGALGRSGCEEADVDVLVLHELLELRQHVGLDELLALRRALGAGGAAVLLQLDERRGAVVGDAAQDVDEDGVGLGDVEADVGNGVADELLENGEDRASDNGEGESGGESLLRVSL